MDALLKSDKEQNGEIMQQTVSIAGKFLSALESTPPSRFVSEMKMQELPDVGMGAKNALEFFSGNYMQHVIASSGPRYFGFVTGGSTPASVAGDWLVSTFDMNACGSNDSIAPQLEKQTIHFFKQLFGLDESFFGSFVTGATMANFTGLAIGRQWVGERSGRNVSMEGMSNLSLRILSGTPHSSILKSMSMLGIGRDAWISVQTLPDREAVDIADLEKHLKEQEGNVIVVANAGTVNTVDFDDLQAIGELKQKYDFWMHVDAAFGGFAALTPKHRHLMRGIDYADSITIDAHKWLNVPYDAAMQFTRHPDLQLKIFRNSAAYLGDPLSPDYFHYTPETSRRWRALPSWFSIMAYGKRGHQEIVERNCEAAFYFGNLLQSSDLFRLLAAVRMNVVCFTVSEPSPEIGEIYDLLKRIRDDGRVFFTPTVYQGVPAIRAAISNWRTELPDMKLAFEVLNEIRSKQKVMVTT